jgi:putative heme-binding domain-containing protein
VNAPDGTLYVLDMSRAVIEAIHIPLDVVKHLDLKQGRNQGHIYRIAPPGFHFVPPPCLSEAKTTELVAAILRSDAWYRDTAHRLIYERQDPSAIKPLRKLIYPGQAPLPQSRINALWSLEGLRALQDEDINLALLDTVPQVRAQAVQLAARRLNGSPALLEKVINLAADADVRVRFQTALALGESNDPRVGSSLLSIARSDAANRWIRAAVLSSCIATAHRLILDLWTDQVSPISTAQAELLEQLAEIVGTRNRPADIDRVLNCLALNLRDVSRLALRDRLVLGLARGLRRSGGQFPVDQAPAQSGITLVSHLIQQARTKALDSRLPEAARVEAISTLNMLAPAGSRAQLLELLEPLRPVAIQVAIVRALVEVHSADVATVLLPRLRTFEPRVQTAAVQTLLSLASSTKALLQAISLKDPSTGITPALIDLADRTPLLKHRDAEIARLAKILFAQTAPRPRAQVIDDYVTALRMDGNAARGIRVFERECMACHRVGARGFALGPDLTGSPSGEPASLLANILDPNANVAPNSVQYLVIDQNGRSYAGIIASETATSLTLRRGGGAEDTILRVHIAEMTSTVMSLMPEGLEKTISKPEMADLIVFLRAFHRGGDDEASSGREPQSLDIGTLPGLLEPNN